MHIWGGKAEAKVYNPNLGKLDPKTVSCRFMGYAERSKGFHFNCPNYTNRVVETGKAKFLEYDEDSEGANKNFTFDEEEEIGAEDCNPSNIPIITYELTQTLSQPKAPIELRNENQNAGEIQEELNEMDLPVEPQPHQQEIKRSTRERRANTLLDFVYLNETYSNDCDFNDPMSYNEAITSEHFEKWLEAIQSELESMEANKVWELVELQQ
ncbi:unnamed protein product [Prunus armeniaca]